MRYRAALIALLEQDAARMAALEAVRALAPDGWIAAGFVRNAVWDRLHARGTAPPVGDIDVIRHDVAVRDEAVDRALEHDLRARLPGYDWSVKNQARMHARNGDAPYRDIAAAMRHWPETATAVAVRLTGADAIEATAPFGLDDLFAPVLRPTPRFVRERRAIFDERVATKRWLVRYPALRVLTDVPG